ncbi:MAG: decarboxylating 6-phosphogluconate dehydrogenase [Candidatus Diapherotrites archaeon]
MKLGFIGLGKMGSKMVLSLLQKNFEVIVYARKTEAMKEVAEKGAIPSDSYEDFCNKLPEPKIIFLMVTHGKPVDEVISSLLPFLKKGDIIVDCGNSFYEDSIRRANSLQKKGIIFMDVGTSGGLKGALNGASLMIGGDKKTFYYLEPIFKALAVKDGYAYLGNNGSGHFAKMVHNGIEYCFLQALGEGYQLLKKSDFNYDLRKVTLVYKNGSVIRSWLIDLLYEAICEDQELSSFEGKIGGGETGIWTLKTARKYKVKMPSLKVALSERKKSMKNQSYASKVVSALRQKFGGHEEPK